MERYIDVLISPDGIVKITTEGFSGATCEEATRALEEGLGTKTSDERTEEFYEGETEKVSW